MVQSATDIEILGYPQCFDYDTSINDTYQKGNTAKSIQSISQIICKLRERCCRNTHQTDKITWSVKNKSLFLTILFPTLQKQKQCVNDLRMVQTHYPFYFWEGCYIGR